MRDLTGAERMWTVDYAVRRREHRIANMPENAPLAGTHRRPIKLAHADFTPLRAEELVRSRTGNEAEGVLARHYLFVNFWRPIRGPLRDAPLALCLPHSVGPDDLAPIRHVYESNRRGEVFGIRYSPTHRWIYLRDMACNEAVAFISYDSTRSCTQTVVPHSAFENRAETGDVLPRESYEQRIIALLP
jgi:hypothetical protein